MAAERVQKGPDIAQGGATSCGRPTVSVGFNHHPGAWDDSGKGVKFHAHAVASANDGK